MVKNLLRRVPKNTNSKLEMEHFALRIYLSHTNKILLSILLAKPFSITMSLVITLIVFLPRIYAIFIILYWYFKYGNLMFLGFPKIA